MSADRAGFVLYAKMVASMALWGATWVSGRFVAQQMAPFPAAFLRFLFASAFLYLLLRRECGRNQASRSSLPRELLPGAAFLALTGVFLYNALLFSGLARIQAGRAAMIVACTPTAVALYAWAALRKPLGALRSAGVALSLLGVAVILTGGDLPSLVTHGASLGDLLILGCLVTWAAYTIAGGNVMRRATRHSTMAAVAALSTVTWSCILGCAMLLPPALATGLVPQALGAGWHIWGNLLFLGIGATGLAFTWYYDGILVLGAARASVFLNLVPVFATILGSLLLGEDPGHALVLGGALVLLGVALANRQPRVRAQGSPA